MLVNRSERLYEESQNDALAYPIDLSPFLIASDHALQGLADRSHHPVTLAQSALAHWNCSIATDDSSHQQAFLELAYWFVDHETTIVEGVGGWPASDSMQTSRLSASTQGMALSVLVRAYQLTREAVFLTCAQRVVCTFQRDILDGGVYVPIGNEGVFFEETAVYPASLALSGFMFALFGLSDYLSLHADPQIADLIQRSLATMHSLLPEFDCGFWTHYDLLQRRLASPAQLLLQSNLLEALSSYTGCEHCATLAGRWRKYAQHPGSRLHYMVSSGVTLCSTALRLLLQTALFPKRQPSGTLRVCIPITGFPVTGGTRAVLAGVEETTQDDWQLHYLTQHVGAHTDEQVIHRFGTAITHPWQFPAVWLYELAGFRKLLSLVRHGATYQLVLPQDGVFTSAYAALAAKLAGIRVVCIDHGNLTLLESQNYRAERRKALETKNWSPLRRFVGRLQYVAYWPSLKLLARLSARLVDHFLIPGVAGDGVEEACQALGIHSSRITRFASMIDVNRYPVLDDATKATARQHHALTADTIMIAMVCRLSPEKGLDVALEALSQALAILPAEIRDRVRVVVAGDGPLRKHIEAELLRRNLQQTVVLWGETTTQDVISLLTISDIFLYTSVRGACLSMAILEAMASGCAVIASTLPLANVQMLAEGRGIIVPPGDSTQTAQALARLVQDPALYQRMGKQARAYVATRHNATIFRRVLMRVTYWAALDEFLSSAGEGKDEE